MTNNKEQAWRLKDDEGNYVGVPKLDMSNVTITMGGREIGRMQSISSDTIAQIGTGRPYTLGAESIGASTIRMDRDGITVNNGPRRQQLANGQITIADEMVENQEWDTINVALRQTAQEMMRRESEQFRREYLGTWHETEYMDIPIREERIEQQYTLILDIIMSEVHEYQRRYRNRASYISLSREGYRSFYVATNRRGMSSDQMMGIEVMCNPLQERVAMALGSAAQEGIEGGLYYE